MNIIDVFLLDKFQRISDWLQDWFGFNNFAIAKKLNFLVVIFIGLRIFYKFLEGKLWDLILLPFTVLFLIALTLIIAHAKRSCENNPTFKNPLALQFSFGRVIFAFIAVALALPLLGIHYNDLMHGNIRENKYHNIAELFWSGSDVLIFLWLYFGSCTPKPYKPSKIKKFLEKVVRFAKEAGSKITSPIPRLVPIPAVSN